MIKRLIVAHVVLFLAIAGIVASCATTRDVHTSPDVARVSQSALPAHVCVLPTDEDGNDFRATDYSIPHCVNDCALTIADSSILYYTTANMNAAYSSYRNVPCGITRTNNAIIP